MKSVLTALLALALVGCVAARTTMITSNTAIISGKGNAYVGMADVMQAVLVEAATTTTAHGYRYFGIVDSQNTSRSGTVFLPGQSYTSGTATGTATSYGNTTVGNASYQSNTYTSPSQSFAMVKPGADVTIKMFREGEIDPHAQGVWDAADILATKAANKN